MLAGKNLAIRRLSLVSVALGVAIFGVGASLQSVIALAGIVFAAVSATAFTWVSLGRRAAFGGLASGLVGAIVAWVVMRTMMRWVALSSEMVPVLTIEGTSAILFTSVMMSILPAMGYIQFRKRYGASFVVGLLYGLLLVAVGGVPVLLLLSGEIISIAREPLIPISLILTVPVVYALILEVSLRRLGNPQSVLPVT